MAARLILHLPMGPARVVDLAEDREQVVGRETGSDVPLDDERVSRQHARFTPPAGAGEPWTVTDLGSKNGTAVDGSPVQAAPLPDRCWVNFGGLLARFERVERLETEDERLRRWRTSLDLSRGLAPAEGLERLLRRILDSVLALSGAERGMVLLAEPGGDLTIAATAGLSSIDLAHAEFSGSVAAVERVLATGRPVATSDARTDAVLSERPSVLREGIRALLCVPLKVLDRLAGAVYADSRRPGAAFTELDLEILEGLASQAGMAIAVARLDHELHALASELEQEGPAGRSWSERFEEVLDRSLGPHLQLGRAAEQPAGTTATTDEGTWHGVLARHRRALGVEG
ncbi:MAG TPA: GAF domain-containing protein [Thermoanaerobaculia bacterium]|nr:GAF domain-containing protein [Thermoanaerobaculia bacterium]